MDISGSRVGGGEVEPSFFLGAGDFIANHRNVPRLPTSSSNMVLVTILA